MWKKLGAPGVLVSSLKRKSLGEPDWASAPVRTIELSRPSRGSRREKKSADQESWKDGVKPPAAQLPTASVGAAAHNQLVEGVELVLCARARLLGALVDAKT